MNRTGFTDSGGDGRRAWKIGFSGMFLKTARWLAQLRVARLIILPRLVQKQPRLSFTWDYFASVEVARTVWSPKNLHCVETEDYNKMIEAPNVPKKAGCRSIGMSD